jgi:hypothetical protein
MVPWLPTSAMASFLNMGKKGRLNSVSKTEFSRVHSEPIKRDILLCGGRDVSWTDSFSLSSVGLHPLNSWTSVFCGPRQRGDRGGGCERGEPLPPSPAAVAVVVAAITKRWHSERNEKYDELA